MKLNSLNIDQIEENRPQFSETFNKKKKVNNKLIFYNHLYQEIVIILNKSFSKIKVDKNIEKKIKSYFQEIESNYSDCIDSNYHVVRAFFFYKQKNIEQCEISFSKAFQSDINNPYIRFNYGIFCLLQNKKIKAKACFIQAINEYPNEIYFRFYYILNFKDNLSFFKNPLKNNQNNKDILFSYTQFLIKYLNKLDFDEESYSLISKWIFPYLEKENRNKEYNLLLNLLIIKAPNINLPKPLSILKSNIQKESFYLIAEAFKTETRCKIIEAMLEEKITETSTIEDIVAITGSTKSTVGRELLNLKNKGVINSKKSSISHNMGNLLGDENFKQMDVKEKIGNFFEKPLNQLLVKIGKTKTRQEIFLYMLNNCDIDGYIKVSSVVLKEELTEKVNPPTILNEIFNLCELSENILERTHKGLGSAASTYKINLNYLK